MKNTIKLIKSKGDIFFLIIAFAIIIIGYTTLLSASVPHALSANGDSYIYIKRQLIFGIASLIISVGIIYFFNYTKINKKIFIYILSIISIGLLCLVFIIGKGANGAQRWIGLGFVSIQPSEIIKLFTIISLAIYLDIINTNGKVKNWIYSFLIPMAAVLILSALIYKMQNHLSAALIIIMVSLIQIFISGVDLKIFGTFFLIVALIFIPYALAKSSISSKSFRSRRIEVWKDPFKYERNEGWQISHSLYALASGGILGKGIGNSKEKKDYLPEPQNDFIFAIYSEETGFIGVAVILLLFSAFIYRGLLIAAKASTRFGQILATGIISMFAIQILMNLAVVSNTIPVTGVALPFFSYGGTAITIHILSLAILYNISKLKEKDKE